MYNIVFQGFGVGWYDVGTQFGTETQSCEIASFNVKFYKNSIGFVVENPTGIEFFKGSFDSNGKAIVGPDAGAWAEVKMFGTTIVNNTTYPTIDFTAVTVTQARLLTVGVHFENNAAASDMNYVAGFLDYQSIGDFSRTTTPHRATAMRSSPERLLQGLSFQR